MSDIIAQEGAMPPEKEFIAIDPASLPKVWPLIRADVEGIDSPEEIIPEEVYCMIRMNQATLFMLHVKGERIGFIVVRLIAPDLHIWLLHAKNGFEVMKTFRPELMDIARRAGATKLTFGSRRKAWQEVAKEHGFSTRMITYESPVDRS